MYKRQNFSYAPFNKLEVGQCVRELGHTAVELIITRTNRGSIETEYKSNGHLRRAVYTPDQQTTLVSVDCKKGV